MNEGSNIAEYDEKIESALEQIEGHLHGDYQISKRVIGLLLLQDDGEIHELVKEKEEREYKAIQSIIGEAQSHHSHSLSYLVTMSRQSRVREFLDDVISTSERRTGGFREKLNQFRENLSRIMMNPLTGIPILLMVLWGIYYSVGVFGAGFLVDWLEGTFFGDAESGWILPYVTTFFEKIIPWTFLQDLFVHENGIITLGIRYAVAIVLPVVGIFFIVFSIIEDTGYLPRLAMLIDRIFKKIGLSGRAVIPMVLGLGCDTMATMVTRTLETKRERVISTFLLALAVPCAAQQAIFVAVLSENITVLLLWIGVVAGELLLVGYLSSKVLPGAQPSFYMELPPLRLPKLTNVLTKTYSRMQWYLLEVIPLFVIASVLIWFGKLTKLFDLLIWFLQPVVKFIGLRADLADEILYGFFRRDYAAASLYDEANRTTDLGGNEFLIAAVVLTLFLPCIAQFLVMIKERGFKTTMAMIGIILVLAFGTGFLLNTILDALSVKLIL